MAALTRDTATSAVKNRMGISSSTTDPLLTDAVIQQQLQFSIDDIAGEYDWPWLSETASVNFSSGTAAPPSGYRKITHLELNGQQIPHYDLADVLHAQPVQPGWYIEDETLKSFPSGITQTGVTVHFLKRENLVGDSNISPVLPQEFHQVWVVRAAWYCSSIRRDQTLKSELGAEYDQAIRRMRDDISRFAGPRQVVNRRGRYRVGSWNQ
jgi:hypothetical protein